MHMQVIIIYYEEKSWKLKLMHTIPTYIVYNENSVVYLVLCIRLSFTFLSHFY